MKSAQHAAPPMSSTRFRSRSALRRLASQPSHFAQRSALADEPTIAIAQRPIPVARRAARRRGFFSFRPKALHLSLW